MEDNLSQFPHDLNSLWSVGDWVSLVSVSLPDWQGWIIKDWWASPKKSNPPKGTKNHMAYSYVQNSPPLKNIAFRISNPLQLKKQ